VTKLRIVAPGMTSHNAQVYLDDKPLERVTGVLVTMAVDEVNHATISFYPSEIEIEGEVGVTKLTVEPSKEEAL
jgi:hypothetical protein